MTHSLAPKFACCALILMFAAHSIPALAESDAYRQAYALAKSKGKSDNWVNAYASAYSDAKAGGRSDENARKFAEIYAQAYAQARAEGKSDNAAQAYAADFAQHSLDKHF